MLIYGLAIFASAFLLFQVQPIIAKIILPWFGGSAAVWTVCLLFFQVVLLLGYLYAHGLVQNVRPKFQAWTHISLLALSAFSLPILPKDWWRPSEWHDPTFRILGLLAMTIGLPYFLLSATGPLLQAWYGGEREGAIPYRLFALSNAGSMLGLASYPLVVEPHLSTRHQSIGWSLAYVGASVLCAAVALRPRRAPAAQTVAESKSAPTWGVRLLWIALAACGSTFLLAVTNQLSRNLAAIPFLWVLPLSLYLLSFILCFGGNSWYRRGLFLRFFVVALGSMTYALSPAFVNLPLVLSIPLFSLALFLCCTVCHGELARLKPAPQHLTSFYLMISLGGALGGIFVGFLAPRIFRWYLELPIVMVACAALVLVVLHRDPASSFYRARWQPGWLTALVLTLGMIVYLIAAVIKTIQAPHVMVRNFYGVLRVMDVKKTDAQEARRVLLNGTINHGEQFLTPGLRDQPTTYYAPRSGIGLALHEAEQHRPLRVGVIGLGTGTLASYGRPGDYYTFYEINPLDIKLAETEFTFLKDSEAKIDIVLGDARLSLERQPPQAFDVLAVDAFSGDSIPVHLLTREAFALFFRHLNSGGTLAVHVSNGYVNLQPVVQRAAEALGKQAIVIDNRENVESDMFRASWVLISGRQNAFEQIDIKLAATPVKMDKKVRLWTDDYSNLFQALAM